MKQKKFDPLNPPDKPLNDGLPPKINQYTFPVDSSPFDPSDRNDNDDLNIPK